MFLLSSFFFNDTATTEIYTLSLHDALPICGDVFRRSGDGDRPYRCRPGAALVARLPCDGPGRKGPCRVAAVALHPPWRDRKCTPSELQSQSNLVCRLLLDKKNNRRGLSKRR